MRARVPPALLLAVFACGRGESEAARAMRVTEEGFDLYRARCSACHEVDGGIGPRLRREVVAAHQPPGRLFEYLRRTMPYGAPGTLSDDEYWKVVQFLLVSRELADSTKLVRPPASD